MLWSIVAYRKSQGAVADTTLVHNTKVEIIWTAVPVIILIAMAVRPRAPSSRSRTRRKPAHHQSDRFQWGWNYEYLDKACRSSRGSIARAMRRASLDRGSIPTPSITTAQR